MILLMGLTSPDLIHGQSQLIHFPVKTGFVGQSIGLEARLESVQQQVTYVRIFYRVKGNEDYQYVEMDEETDRFVGAIPAMEVRAPMMEYFLLALLSDESVMTNPSSNPFYSPYSVNIDVAPPQMTEPTERTIRSAEGSSITTLILSPEPGSSIPSADLVIALSFISEQGEIDDKSIRLYLDGVDVTSQAEVSEYIVSFTPERISQGNHVVKLTSADKAGGILEPVVWSFRIISSEMAKEQTKRQFQGRVFFDVKNERVSDRTLSTNSAGTNFSGAFGALKINASAFITSREKKDQQPRNRFLLDVGTSWIGVRLGDTNPQFNDLMLWGKRVRGVEAYLKFGFFNVEFVKGESYRGIEGKLYNIQVDNGDTLWIHPVTGDTIQSVSGIYQYGTYKQSLMGLRTSLGSGRRFQLGLNLVKVKDDMESITHGITPKDNVVIGPDILLAFDNRRIELKAGAAFSLLTNDISAGAFTKADLDSLFDTDVPIDPAQYQDYLVLNASTTPLDPRKLTSLAYNAEFKLNYLMNFLRIQYKSIGSDYVSLGNTFLRTDIRGFSIYDRLPLWDNQLSLNLGYDRFMDELDKEDDDNANTAPTDLNTFSLGISYYPRSKGLPKVNFNFKDHQRNNGLNALNAVGNRTQDVSVQLAYDVELLNLKHTLSLGIIGSDRVDDFYSNTSNIAANIRMFTWQTKFQAPLTTTFTFATNENRMGKDVNSIQFKYSQIGLNAIYLMMNNRLKVNGGINNTSATGSMPVNNVMQNYTDYKRFSLNLGGNYQISSSQYLLVDGYLISFKDEVTSTSNKDTIFRARYEIRF